MKFVKNSLKSVDYSKLEENTVANATLKSFNYQSGYCFGTFVADGDSVRAIIGPQDLYPIKDMISLKGVEVTIEYAGTTVSNGTTYPRYYVQF